MWRFGTKILELAYSLCLWMDQDLWLLWPLVTPSPYCVQVSAEEFTYSEWTTAKGCNCGKWQHSEAKRHLLDNIKPWPFLSQCGFVFFHIILGGVWCGANVLCLGLLEGMSVWEVNLSPVVQNQVQSLETWSKHKVLNLRQIQMQFLVSFSDYSSETRKSFGSKWWPVGIRMIGLHLWAPEHRVWVYWTDLLMSSQKKKMQGREKLCFGCPSMI